MSVKIGLKFIPQSLNKLKIYLNTLTTNNNIKLRVACDFVVTKKKALKKNYT